MCINTQIMSALVCYWPERLSYARALTPHVLAPRVPPGFISSILHLKMEECVWVNYYIKRLPAEVNLAQSVRSQLPTRKVTGSIRAGDVVIDCVRG